MAFLKDRTQVKNPKSEEYVLIDTKNGRILGHSHKRFKSVRYIK